MRLESDAPAVAAGDLAVIEPSHALDLAQTSPRRPLPLAAYRAGDW